MVETKKLQTMTKEHYRWNEFIDRLCGPEGCDFRYNSKGKTIWNCIGGKDKSLATKILAKMGGIDVEKSLEYFEANGGHCDCEIVFNLDLQPRRIAE